MNSFAIYPNPINQNKELTLIYELNGHHTTAIVRIHDLHGKQVYVSELKNHNLTSHTISTKNLTKGIYMISINIDEKQETDRIVIN